MNYVRVLYFDEKETHTFMGICNNYLFSLAEMDWEKKTILKRFENNLQDKFWEPASFKPRTALLSWTGISLKLSKFPDKMRPLFGFEYLYNGLR